MNAQANTQISAISGAFNRAYGCALQLDELGCTVLEVTAQPDRSIVRIDSPHDAFKGAMHKRQRVGDHIETTMVSFRMGAKIEWIVREPLPLGATA